MKEHFARMGSGLLALLAVGSARLAVAAEDAGPGSLAPPVAAADAGPADSALAECAALEPTDCYARAIELLRPDGGNRDRRRGHDLLQAACRRGHQPSCAISGLTRPQMIVAPKFEYPPSMKASGASGFVSVKCVLPADGRPSDCKVLASTAADFSAAALAAVSTAQFTPAKFDGVPTDSTYVFNLEFRLPGGPRPARLLPRQDWLPMQPPGALERCKGDDAAACHQEALRLAAAHGDPGDADRAARLFGAACKAKHAASCEVLSSRFDGPQRLGLLTPPSGHGQIVCWITVLGKAERCRATPGSTIDDRWTRAVQAVVFQPAMLDGKPFETEWGFSYGAPGPGAE